IPPARPPPPPRGADRPEHDHAKHHLDRRRGPGPPLHRRHPPRRAGGPHRTRPGLRPHRRAGRRARRLPGHGRPPVPPSPHRPMTMTMNVTLNNGVQMPALGFGVFQTPPDVTAQAVGTALATGYRLIDTAAAHGNEREGGQAIRRSGLARDDVFIETKIWISDYGYDQTLHAF